MGADQHPTALTPVGGQPVREVINMAEREGAEAWRRKMILIIIRKAQRSLEIDLAYRVLVNVGETEEKAVSIKIHHQLWLLPIAVPDLADDAEDRVVGSGFQLPQQPCEKHRPLADDLLQFP